MNSINILTKNYYCKFGKSRFDNSFRVTDKQGENNMNDEIYFDGKEIVDPDESQEFYESVNKRPNYIPRGRTFQPFYDTRADYNTDSKSYYDYLARRNYMLHELFTKLINRLLARNITVTNTESITISKTGDWIKIDGDYNKYTDIIDLKAQLNLSSQVKNVTVLINGESKTINVKNGTVVYADGVWSPDYMELISQLIDNINDIYNRLDGIDQQINQILNDIKNIYNLLDDIQHQINALSGTDFTRLTIGTDYELDFLNGWHTDSNDVLVRVSTTNSSTFVRISAPASNADVRLQNDDLIENVKFNHGENPATPLPNNYAKSRLFRIRFKGKYAILNEGSANITTNSGVFNIRPASLRASWSPTYVIYFEGGGVVPTFGSYSDGYNSQLDVYASSGLTSTSCGLTIQYTTSQVVKD